MSTLQYLSTNEVAPRARLGFWNHAVSDAVRDVSAEPFDSGTFSGSLARLELNDAQFIEICGDPSRVTRPSCTSSQQPFVLEMLLSGAFTCRADGIDYNFRPGDFWFIPPTKCVMRIQSRTRILSIRILRTSLAACIAVPERITGRVVSGEAGAGAIASDYVQRLWREIRSGHLQERTEVFAGIATKLVASALAGIPGAEIDGTTTATRHAYRIRAFIEQHLREPELTPAMVAASLRMTQSYLHRRFAIHGETVSQFILRRRLEECHHEIENSIDLSRTLTDIAMRQGFNSLSHFCRAFRERYDMTPGELARASRR
jgi:AraC-like DNA-binding protein